VVSKINGTFHTDEREYFDNHPHDLQLALYDDKAWPKFRQAMIKGSLCRERLQLASWKSKIQPQFKTGPGIEPRHEFTFVASLTPPKASPHYWYAMLMDCYLEEYDAHPPPMIYTVVFMNGKSHLPADEAGMTFINGLALVAMLCYGIIYAFNLVNRWLQLKQGHLITLVFGAAYALQTLSVLCELCHLQRFSSDGKGLRWRHTYLALDFLSGLLQSISELTISVLLISLGFGWTLGLQSQEPVEGFLGKVLAGLQRPATLLNGLRSPSSVLLLAIALVQLVLQAVGRGFEEDFNNFHDHEHWPGLCLLLIRLGLWGLFTWALRRSLAVEKQTEVVSFLKQLWMAGTVWFVCLPALVLFAMVLPPYRRHQLVAGGAIVLQTVALALLSTLFLQRSEYYRISSLAHMGSVFESSYGTGKLAVD